MISIDDYLVFVDQALDQMVDLLTSLGDERVNLTPDVVGANSAYAIVTHCLGVMEYWGGAVVAGRTIERDRDAEFVATGEVDALVSRVRAAQRQLRSDLAELDPFAVPRGPVPRDARDLPLGRTRGGALMHVYEELAQHLGQLEVGRDVVMRSV